VQRSAAERSAPASAAGPTSVRIGVDLGGTKTEVVCLDASGAQRLRRRRPTPRGDYDATVALIVEMVRDAAHACGAGGGVGSVGIGIPGTISASTGLVKNANSTWLNGRPLARDLESALRQPVRVANDANCFAVSEAADGAGAGARTVFGVILGTGVGGGLVVDGRVLTGANGIAGEWGHNPLPWPRPDETPGRDCYCGRRGCIETWLSGPAYARDAGRDDALERYVDRLARGLATVINLFDPEVIVLGGGLSNIDALYQRVPSRWGRYVFSDSVRTELRRNRHGDSSGVLGAARLWDDAPA
jgi:fructokinase